VAQLAGVVGGSFEVQSASVVHSPVIPSTLASEAAPPLAVLLLLHDPMLNETASVRPLDSGTSQRLLLERSR
jgi:hypothetical protein